MSTIEKLRLRFYGSPVPKDITIDEVLRLAEFYGCYVRTGGNHQITIVNKKTVWLYHCHSIRRKLFLLT